MIIIPRFKGNFFILFSITSLISAIFLVPTAYREIKDKYRNYKEDAKLKNVKTLDIENKSTASSF